MTSIKDNVALNSQTDEQIASTNHTESNHLINESEITQKYNQGWQESLLHSSNTNNKTNFLLNKSFDNCAQNSEFALSIMNNYIINLGYITQDSCNAVAKYSSNILSSNDQNETNKSAKTFYNNIVRSVEQNYLVHTQIMLDWCNCVIVPAVKQVSALRDKLNCNLKIK